MTAPLSAAVPSTTPLAENPVQGLCAVQEKWRAFIAPFHHIITHRSRCPTPCSGTGYAYRSADDFSPVLWLMVQAVANG